jgi:hypothetical protein
MTPRVEAIAYRIRAICVECGWNITVGELAEELNLSYATVRNVLLAKSWHGRVRPAFSRNLYGKRPHSAISYAEELSILHAFAPEQELRF